MRLEAFSVAALIRRAPPQFPSGKAKGGHKDHDVAML